MDIIAKIVKNDQMGSSSDLCYIPNRVVKKRVIKRSKCTSLLILSSLVKKLCSSVSAFTVT